MENITIVLLFFIIIYIICHYYNTISFSELECSKEYHSNTGAIETDTFTQSQSTNPKNRQSQLYLTDPVF
jgi:hypothetical protein